MDRATLKASAQKIMRSETSRQTAALAAIAVLTSGIMLALAPSPRRPSPDDAMERVEAFAKVAGRTRAFDTGKSNRIDNSSNTVAGQNSKPKTQITIGCLPGMVRVQDKKQDFCIDKYEAYVMQLHGDPAGRMWEVPHPHNKHPEEGAILVAKSRPRVYPQAYISQVQAESACRNAHKRLCTEDEWRTGCMGRKKTTYPYGNEERYGMCNVRKEHLPSAWWGANNNSWSYGNFNDPRLNVQPGFLNRTGVFGLCVSDYGMYDGVGNVHEWTSGRTESGNGIFLGGFFSNTRENGPGCRYSTMAHEPTYHDYSTGFRCCRNPDK